MPARAHDLSIVGDALQNPLQILAGFGLAAVVQAALRTEQGRAFWDEWVLRLPVVGDLVTKIAMARFARLFSVLLKAGVPILRALDRSYGRIDLHSRALEEQLQAAAP